MQEQRSADRAQSPPHAPEAFLGELQARPQWVTWRNEMRKGKQTKVPYDPKSPLDRAKVTDPLTWSTFDVASSITNVAGIGFVFTSGDPYVGVDLDDCIIDGVVHPDALRLLERLGTYYEVSPSGQGIKAISIGQLRCRRHRTTDTPWGGAFEVYDQKRYFAITFNGGGSVAESQSELDAITCELFPTEKLQVAPGGSQGLLRADMDDAWLREAEARGGWGSIKDVSYFLNRLRQDHQWYLREQPTRDVWDDDVQRYDSRSEMEQSIIFHLVLDGASDDQIITIADSGLPKHLEAGGNTHYITESIWKARFFAHATNRKVTHPDGGWPRQAMSDADRGSVTLAKGQPLREFAIAVAEQRDIQVRSAYKIKDRLVKLGWIDVSEDGRMYQLDL